MGKRSKWKYFYINWKVNATCVIVCVCLLCAVCVQRTEYELNAEYCQRIKFNKNMEEKWILSRVGYSCELFPFISNASCLRTHRWNMKVMKLNALQQSTILLCHCISISVEKTACDRMNGTASKLYLKQFESDEAMFGWAQQHSIQISFEAQERSCRLELLSANAREHTHTTRDAPQQCDKKMCGILENRNVVKWNEFQFGSATASTLKMPLHRFLPETVRHTHTPRGRQIHNGCFRATECESIHLYSGHTTDSTHTYFIVCATVGETGDTCTTRRYSYWNKCATAKWRINCQQ